MDLIHRTDGGVVDRVDVRDNNCLNANGRHFFSRFKRLADECRCLATQLFIIIAVLSLNFPYL